LNNSFNNNRRLLTEKEQVVTDDVEVLCASIQLREMSILKIEERSNKNQQRK